MAETPTAPTTTLPVRFTVGDITTDVGEVTLEPGVPVRAALACLLREAADALDRVDLDEDQEVSPDGTA